MFRTKTIKKRTKNRLTLLKNLRKGKARMEPRCSYTTIPQPSKLSFPSEIHHLYGDIVLMHQDDKIVTDPSMLNKFKVLKQAQIVEAYDQRLVRVMLQDKDIPLADWRSLVDNLSKSENTENHEWADLIRSFCERYESTLKKIEEDHDNNTPNSVYRLFEEADEKTEKIRDNFCRNYPYTEIKSKFRNGRVEVTEVLYNEKFVSELGYTVDNITTKILEEGLVKVLSLDNECAPLVTRWRLKKYLSIFKDGAQSPEIEGSIVMKSGFMNKIKFRMHYQNTFEKGEPGFAIIGIIVAKQTPFIDKAEPDVRVDTTFVEMMANKEKESASFLSTFYNTSTEQRYSNYDKICKIKEI